MAFCIFGLAYGILGFISFVTAIILDDDKDFCILLGMIFIFICIADMSSHYETKITLQCEDEGIAYELIESVSDVTGVSEHDVFYVFKYAAGADMDLIDAVLLIDPDLTEEQATAIITTSDLKQSKEDK
jgi:hypothetical protein